MSYRLEKFSSTLKNNLALIFLNDFDDPELKFVTISHTEVSKDLKNVTAFVSSPDANSDLLIKKLENVKHILKRELAKKMRLKYIPEISFKFDSSFIFNQKNSTENEL